MRLLIYLALLGLVPFANAISPNNMDIHALCTLDDQTYKIHKRRGNNPGPIEFYLEGEEVETEDVPVECRLAARDKIDEVSEKYTEPHSCSAAIAGYCNGVFACWVDCPAWRGEFEDLSDRAEDYRVYLKNSSAQAESTQNSLSNSSGASRISD